METKETQIEVADQNPMVAAIQHELDAANTDETIGAVVWHGRSGFIDEKNGTPAQYWLTVNDCNWEYDFALGEDFIQAANYVQRRAKKGLRALLLPF